MSISIPYLSHASKPKFLIHNKFKYLMIKFPMTSITWMANYCKSTMCILSCQWKELMMPNDWSIGTNPNPPNPLLIDIIDFVLSNFPKILRVRKRTILISRVFKSHQKRKKRKKHNINSLSVSSLSLIHRSGVKTNPPIHTNDGHQIPAS